MPAQSCNIYQYVVVQLVSRPAVHISYKILQTVHNFYILDSKDRFEEHNQRMEDLVGL